MNNKRQRLIDLCQIINLVIGGSMLPHTDIHKYTWMSAGDKSKNKTDYICISNTWSFSVEGVRINGEADIHTDHILVIGKLCIKLNLMRNKGIEHHSCNTPTLMKNRLNTRKEYNLQLATSKTGFKYASNINK